MRLSSFLCVLVLLAQPSLIWAQPGPGEKQAAPTAGSAAPAPQPAAPNENAAGAPAPATATAPNETAAPAPSEPAAASGDSNTTPDASASTPPAQEPATTEPTAAASSSAQATQAAPVAPDTSIPSPGELGDRLVGDLPPPPEPKNGWTAPTPILTLHGYMRVRGELMDRFWLGRGVLSTMQMNEGQGPDPFTRFRPLERNFNNSMCADESTTSEAGLSSVCKVRSLQFANMRFRFSPQINISEDIRIKSTFDILDNYVLGTGPQSFYGRGDVAKGVFPGTDLPTGQVILPRRVWAEVRNRDLGELRFGLMPDHWGLGMLYNAGNGLDDDYSSDLGRVMGTTKLLGFYLSAAYDFLNEGMTGGGVGVDHPAYDVSQLEDLDQFTFSVVRRVPDEDEDAVLARGDVLLNGGARFQLRHQDSMLVPGAIDKMTGLTTYSTQNLSATIYTPDIWGQLRYGKLRLELEAAWVVGHMLNPYDHVSKQYVSQFGAAFESELRLLNDKLALYFYTGGASGDSEAEGLSSDANLVDFAGASANNPANNSRVSTFRFHPAYRVDLILWRSILGSVTGAYYFKPGISYDFVKDTFGQLFGARVDAVWSRASAPVQTWGNNANLGVELDAQVYWRSADGPNMNDGYHAALQYGVLFPMKGLAYAGQGASLATAQTLRLVLGVMF
jgi:uncharacterized protein (TIGR04551 family)